MQSDDMLGPLIDEATLPVPLRSYAQNQEDVVLWRALGYINNGHYVEVGAYHPTIKSTSYAFYEHGWSGLLIEPQEEFCELSRAIRPRDQIIQSAVGSEIAARSVFYKTPGGTRSTMQASIAEAYGDFEVSEVPCTTLDQILAEIPWATNSFHFLVLDVEGSEADALAGIDLMRYRPWVLVVESIDPLTKGDVSSNWINRIEESGYHFSHFDGVSRYFVANEHAELLPKLYPACSTDDYVVDFPHLSLQRSHTFANSGNSLIKSTQSLLADLVDKIGVNTARDTPDNLADAVIDSLSNESLEKLDQIELLAATLQVATSRARLHHSLGRLSADEHSDKDDTTNNEVRNDRRID